MKLIYKKIDFIEMDEYFKYLNKIGVHDTTMIKLPHGNKANFKKVYDAICEHCCREKVLAIIIYGSVLRKKCPNDLDVMIVHLSDIENISIFIRKSKIEYFKRCIGFETVNSSGEGTFVYPITIKESYGEDNPMNIDIKIRNIDFINKSLIENWNGNVEDTTCYNALKHGVVLAKQKKYDSELIFGIKNINTNKIYIKDLKIKIK
jgi:hypothetical protein